ncbi:hypothetical protein FACS1894159_00320 [Bacteroidia bacterium]|nr:hypothetical protein FACS1894159_00320 [Bacteroidia bacterium]
MKQLALIALTCVMFVVRAVAEDALRTGFANPPASAHAGTWWHWVNGNVSKEGITADLEAIKAQGIQSVTVFNVDMGFQNSGLHFLSPEWLELFRFAVLEAGRLGMELSFFNSAGWSTTGGPWITPETTMQTVVWSETTCRGGTLFKARLARPQARMDYYRDIAVLAFPKPRSDRRIDDLSQKSLAIIQAFAFKSHISPDPKQVEPSAVVHREDIVDLSAKVSGDGSLEWDAPQGEWVILRIGHTPTGRSVFPPIQGGGGPECDKMSRKAIDLHWERSVKPALDQVRDQIGSTVTCVFQDSYEAGCGNWTPDFDKEFLKRRGYDCLSYLPTLAGYYVESGEESERFLWDFRRTVGDLMADNYYGRLGELCHQNGLKFATETYGGPFESMQAGSAGDIVISEFWVHNKLYMDNPRFVASMAHLGGNIAGAESFTNYGGLTNHPATLKSIGDKAWTEGINRLIFHTCVHQPWNVGPGLTLGKYGMDFNRLNTWWKQGRPYLDYIARSQFLLQEGRFSADFLVFAGEESPNNPFIKPEISALGYNYDFIGSDKILTLTVENGLIRTPVGGSYRVLMLPQTTWMTPKLLRKINELVRAGATVIGPKPIKSPSLTGFPACDNEVSRLADSLWDSRSIRDITPQQAMAALSLPPDFSCETPDRNLHFIHRIAGEGDVYFVATGYDSRSQQVGRFRVAGKLPELWDPQTGQISEAVWWRENGDGTTSVPLSFDPCGSVFVVFRKPAPADHIVKTTMEYAPPASRPLPGLEVILARYQAPLPDRLTDVTQILRDAIQNGGIDMMVNTSAFGYDPAPRNAKEARVEYRTGGVTHLISVNENQRLTIRAADGKQLEILRATYGRYAGRFDTIPQLHAVYDLKKQIADRIASGQLAFKVDNTLVGPGIDAADIPRELLVVYTTGGEQKELTVAQGHTLDLSVATPEPQFMSDGKNKVWAVTPCPGKFGYVTSSGASKSVRVKHVPEPVELTGPWEVTFMPGRGAPEGAVFDTLIDWIDSSEQGIRYYSGTAVYRKSLTLTKDMLRAGHLELDLGRVGVIAEVILNGETLATLWKAPFRVSLTDAARAGDNLLEIHVTNLWPNRLIGDERYPEDYQRSGSVVRRWPEWLVNGTERPTKRVTFTTWKHWDADSPLLPSGLMGPVVIRTYVHAPVK